MVFRSLSEFTVVSWLLLDDWSHEKCVTLSLSMAKIFKKILREKPNFTELKTTVLLFCQNRSFRQTFFENVVSLCFTIVIIFATIFVILLLIFLLLFLLFLQLPLHIKESFPLRISSFFVQW